MGSFVVPSFHVGNVSYGGPFHVLNEVNKEGAYGQLGETCFAYVYCAHHEEERKRSRVFLWNFGDFEKKGFTDLMARKN